MSITHRAGTTDVEINENGIYQAAFRSTVMIGSEATIPSSVRVRL
jgi:hypothetical protein